MFVEAWHGGWGRLEEISDKYFDTGDGIALAKGFYTASTRVGGEYYSNRRRTLSEDGVSYLHRVGFDLAPSELWDYDSGVQPPWGKSFKAAHMGLGAGAITRDLRNNGIKVIKQYEQDNPKRGYTYIVLDVSIVQILESFRFHGYEAEEPWEKLPGKA